jgi:hypothetical protein
MPLGKRHNTGDAGDPAERQAGRSCADVALARANLSARNPPVSSTRLREVPRYHRYSYKTEEIDVGWIVRHIRFSGTRHPAEMGKPRKFRDSMRIYRATPAPKVSKGWGDAGGLCRKFSEVL